jgi:hypothetical protein
LPLRSAGFEITIAIRFRVMAFAPLLVAGAHIVRETAHGCRTSTYTTVEYRSCWYPETASHTPRSA